MNVPTPETWEWVEAALADWEQRGLRRHLIERSGPQWGSRFVHNGREYLNFGSNDYLGLAASPELVLAVRERLNEIGWGAGASPLVTGRGAWHARLERELATFEGMEAALLFTSGYAANVGTITALVDKEDAIYSDAKNHASIIDGCRLSGAKLHVYRHLDYEHLQQLLVTSGTSARRRLIVSDGLFSMDGDVADVEALCRIARQHAAMLLVDEAHGTGVLGPNLRGVSDGYEADIVRIGTLSKALGSHGGFVAGRQTVVDWLANRARSYVFSTAAPEALAIAGCTALTLAHEHTERVVALLQTAAQLRAALHERGWNVGQSQSQIIPIYIGDPERTMQLSQKLREQGFWVPGIRPPSVPEGESLLRISLSAAHTPDMIERLCDALNRCK